MESKGTIDGWENDTDHEFIVISQTLVDLCEKVCSKTAFDTTSVHDGGINCENPNVPKVMHVVVKPMVTTGENGCSGEPLGTEMNGAVRRDVECDSTSDSGALKPIVVLNHSENGSTEPLGTSVDGAVKHGMECDTSDTLKPLVTLTVNENGCSTVPLNTATMKDGADKCNMECNTIAGTDTVMSDDKSTTLLVGEDAKDNHHEKNQSLCVLDGEAIEEPCCNGGRMTQEDHVVDKTGTDNGDVSGMGSSKDDFVESGKELSASGQCTTSLPVVSNTGVSELNGLEPEHENSIQTCGTNTHAVEFSMTTENARNKVSQVQNADGLNEHSDQNVIDVQPLRQRRKKKAISKKKRSMHHQTPPSSRSVGHIRGGNVEVNDFEFVLSVVQQDLEEIQMVNATAATVSSGDDTHKDSSDDEGESSDTSSSPSTSDSPPDESNSKSTCKRFAENHIEEDEDRVHVTSGHPRTRDEVLSSELPPPPDLEIMADKDQIKQIGEIESIINAETMVIIKSFPDVPALDTDSILFLSNGRSFGQVFEIFGQVRSPHYCVRFNSEEEIRVKDLSVGQTVFYAPNVESMTNFVFVSKIQSVKGSDASWKHDQEPPNELLEYSDDEAESAAKASKKKANRLKHRNQTLIQERDSQENAKKQRTPNAAADCAPPTSKQPWLKQVARQRYQPRQSCQPPPPVPFNIRPRNPATEFYSERFPLGQNVPMQFNPRSHPPRLGPQPMPRLPSGGFYNHQQPHQYHVQAPVPPPYPQQPLPPPYPQQPLPPPQFRSLQPCIPVAQHGTYSTVPIQSNPTNGQPQHVPGELSLPSQNVGQPLDQVWSPRVNVPSGQPVNLGQQFMARPGWPTVHPPTQPPFYCPPR